MVGLVPRRNRSGEETIHYAISGYLSGFFRKCISFNPLLSQFDLSKPQKMGRVQRSRRMHKNIKDIKKKHRTKRRTKDMDQLHEDMKAENAERLRSQEVD